MLDGYKILQISDLHIDVKTSYEEIKNLIHQVNQTTCDMLVITGDILDCNVKKIKEKLYLFKNLKHNSFYVSGNHDLVHGYHELNTLMKKCNIQLLDNRYEIIKYKKQDIILAGLSDKFSNFFKIQRHEKELTQEIKKSNLPKIFLAHQPKDYIHAQNAQSDIFLCGHTHGGQIYPFNYLVRLVQPFVSGLYYHKNLAIYVNNGLGAWGIKYRFFVNSEITILELNSHEI